MFYYKHPTLTRIYHQTDHSDTAEFSRSLHCFDFLVSTHIVSERLSEMQQQARLQELLVQNSLSAPTQVFQECWSGVPPPPPPNENLDRSRHLGFQLVHFQQPKKCYNLRNCLIISILVQSKR